MPDTHNDRAQGPVTQSEPEPGPVKYPETIPPISSLLPSRGSKLKAPPVEEEDDDDFNFDLTPDPWETK